MKRSVSYFGLAAFGLAGLLVAGDAYATSDTDWFHIKQIQFDGESVIRVYSAVTLSDDQGTDNNNPKDCTTFTAGNQYYSITTTSVETRERMYSTLLAAFLAGKKISVRVSETVCSGSGTSGSPVMIGLTVNRDQN